MTEHQRRRRLVRIQLRARHLERGGEIDPEVHREMEVTIAADPHAAASEWFQSKGLTVIGSGTQRQFYPFWRGRW